MLKLAIKWKPLRENLYKSTNEDINLMVSGPVIGHGHVTGNLNLVLESTKCENQENSKYGCRKPLYIQRRHLMNKYFWKNWAFSIVVLRNRLRINRDNGDYVLEVDLTGQSYGIYNNKGKEFLQGYFFEGSRVQYTNIEKEFIEKFIINNHPLNATIENTPFRWASAGILPIVKRGERYYVMLVFRTIPPIGWNLPLGASETNTEYKNLRELMLREFHEEILIVDRNMLQAYILGNQQNINYKDFTIRGCSTYLPPQTLKRLQEHVKIHIDLREKIDKMNLVNSQQIIVLNPVETPFKVQITYDTDHVPKVESDVIFTINPFEQGIDVLGVYKLEFDDNDYPLTGELIQLSNDKKVFLREPVLLLSIDKIKDIFTDSFLNLYLQGLTNHNGGPIVIPRLDSNDYIIEYLDAIDIRKAHIDKRFEELYKKLMSIDNNETILMVLDKLKAIWENNKNTMKYYENNAVNVGFPPQNNSAQNRQQTILKHFDELLQGIKGISHNLTDKDYKEIMLLIEDLRLNLTSVALYFPQLAYIRGYHKMTGEFPPLTQNEAKILLTLCPVTWKSLAIGVKFKII